MTLHLIHKYAFCFIGMYGVGISSFILYQHIESRQKLIKKSDSSKIDLKVYHV